MQYKAKAHYKEHGVAEDYDSARFTSLKGRLTDRAEKKLILNALRLTGSVPPARVLDLPCGTGRVSVLLGSLGYNVFGRDISAEMLKQATAKLAGQVWASRVDFNVGDAEAIPLEDASVDVVISLRLFGHLPPSVRSRVLAEFHRVSSGFVVIAYYDRASVQGLLRRGARAKAGVSWFPVKRSEIEGELAAAGLKMVKTLPLLLGVSETLLVVARKA